MTAMTMKRNIFVIDRRLKYVDNDVEMWLLRDDDAMCDDIVANWLKLHSHKSFPKNAS
jgi:hypothetical protein